MDKVAGLKATSSSQKPGFPSFYGLNFDTFGVALRGAFRVVCAILTFLFDILGLWTKTIFSPEPFRKIKLVLT